MSQELSNHHFYFDEPRLRMTFAGRVLVRVTEYVAILVLVVATFTLLLSYDIPIFFYTGLFFFLVMLDRFIHRGDGDRAISTLAKLPENSKVNLAALMNTAAFSAIERAVDRSVITKKNFLLELASRLFEIPEIENSLRVLDVKPEEFRQKLDALMAEPAAIPAVQGREDYMALCERLATHAFAAAVDAGHDFIKPSDLFAALPAMGDESIDRLFALFSIAQGDLARALIFASLRARFGLFARVPATLGGFASEGSHGGGERRIMTRAWRARTTPTLDRYGIDLTRLARARRIGFLVGHDSEYRRLLEVLAGSSHRSALLVGRPGVGREAIVHHLAYCTDKRVVSLQWQSLIADTASDAPHTLDARLKEVTKEIAAARDLILYIPDMQAIAHPSLIAQLATNTVPIIGASTHALGNETDMFQTIPVQEIAVPQAEKLLIYGSVLLERSARMSITFGAIKRAVAIAKKHEGGDPLPSGAAALLKDALTEGERRGEKIVTAERIAAASEQKSLQQ